MRILEKMKWGLLGLAVFAVANAKGASFDTSVRDRIYAAAATGNVTELKRLEGLGYSLDMTDINGNTAYCQAVWSQNRTAVAALIAAGVDVRPSCLKRIPYVTESRIYAAAHAEDLDQLVAWKKEGLNVDVVNPKTGNSALCEAVYNYDCPAIQTLLRVGSQQAQPCMRRVPQEVRERLQCRPLKIDWKTIGYTVLGAGMTGALVAILAGGGGNGTPTCPVQQRWNGSKCMSCDTCWIGNRCISPTEMAAKPYYREDSNAECWMVSPPPVSLTDQELASAVEKIKNEPAYIKGGFLTQINAAEAYARGYTGYMVERTTPYGRLVNGAVPAGFSPTVTDKKATVGIYSTGMHIGEGGTLTTGISSPVTGEATTEKTAVWNWDSVNKAFFDHNDEMAREWENQEYTPSGSTSGTKTGTYVSTVGAIKNNLYSNEGNSGKPLGFNYDYGPCGTEASNNDDNPKNCYGFSEVIITKTQDSSLSEDTKYKLAAFYDTNGAVRYLIRDSVSGYIKGMTNTAPKTKTEAESTYIAWAGEGGLYQNFFAGLSYTTDYTWNLEDPSPHYTNAGSNNDTLIASKGTLLAGVVGAMNLVDSQMYGVAYNTSILPINKDIVLGLTETQVDKIAGYVNVLLIDQVFRSTQVDDALNAFTKKDSIYTARTVADVFGENKLAAYKLLKSRGSGIVTIIPNGNNNSRTSPYSQPVADAMVPLMSDLNGGTTWDSAKTVLPAVVDTNPLYHLYITVGSLQSLSSEGVGVLSEYSQPCGLAASYCLVAPGGRSGTEQGVYSTLATPASAVYDHDYTFGTSIAAATVAGSVALLMGAYPHLTSQQIVEILFRTATYIEPLSATDGVGTDDYGKYNSVFGRGLINLAAATDPVGGKNGLWVYRAGTSVGAGSGVVTASATHLLSPATITASLNTSLFSSLPSEFVAFDMYNRPFFYSTKELFSMQNRRKTKSLDDFKLFMRGRDPVVIQPTEEFSMMYRSQTKRVSSSSQIPLGLMQMNLKRKNMRYSVFYSQDTTLGKEAYWKRRQVNPFIQMRDAYGLESEYEFNPKWSIEVGWTMGKNGFFDEDDRRFDAPDNRMQAFTSSIVFKPVDKMSFKVAAGVMKETGSSLGMVSSGAFNIKGGNTHFVGAGVVFTPMDKIRLEAMYYYGVTKTNSEGGLMNLSRMTSDSFAVTASYTPTEDHLFGLQVSSPLRVRKGSLNVTLPVGRHPTEDIYYYNTYKADMKPKARELDLSMYYQGNVNEEVSVQSEMGVRLNPDHQADAAPDYRGMVGLKWNY